MARRSELCPRCRGLLAASGQLRWKRLGKWERTLLSQSAEIGRAKSLPVPPPYLENKELVAVRRAIGSLIEKGLVELLEDEHGDPVEERQYERGRLARRERFLVVTRLGHAVARACAADWAALKAVRWPERLPVVKRAILDECGCLSAGERGRFI